MDRLEELAVLAAVLEAGTLAAASRRLRRSPPMVSRALAALERRVGARLIERTTRRLSPTAAGRALAEQARHVLAQYEAAIGQVRNRETTLGGTLRIAAPRLFGRRHVTPLVSTFLSTHPEVRVELELNDRNVDLLEDGIDIALRIGRLEDSSLVRRQVGVVRRLTLASPGYLERRGPPRRPRDLAAHDVVLVPGRDGLMEWRFHAGGTKRAAPVRLQPRLVVNENDAMLNAVRAGHGIGRALSYQVADDIAAGRLVRILADHEPPPLPVQLVIPSAQHVPPRVRAFLDHAVRPLTAICGTVERQITRPAGREKNSTALQSSPR
ncbi:MAG: LysR family transcriptional regulator [Alphaproteobacteria bacterium]|nr:LysR family transcriptional regulator [Alphaproteobacteria bacterium]MCW5742025.1 LysR family transcriptional regulator [Alphaproteobacteria bacterium]